MSKGPRRGSPRSYPLGHYSSTAFILTFTYFLFSSGLKCLPVTWSKTHGCPQLTPLERSHTHNTLWSIQIFTFPFKFSEYIIYYYSLRPNYPKFNHDIISSTHLIHAMSTPHPIPCPHFAHPSLARDLGTGPADVARHIAGMVHSLGGPPCMAAYTLGHSHPAIKLSN